MINRVVLVGRMVRDPELRYLENGTAVCSFTVAVNKFGKKDEADFIQCVAWKKAAENTAQYTSKGSLVGIDGRISTRSYDGKNGKVYVTEVTCDSVQFLDSKKDKTPSTPPQNSTIDNDPFGGEEIELDDSSLPF